MLERTSMKLYPIVKEVLKRMIDENPIVDSKYKVEVERLLLSDESQTKLVAGGVADMRSVLGFLNQNEWVYALNIGNIMQL